MKIKGLDWREIISDSLPESKKRNEHGMTFLSPPKINQTVTQR